MPSDGADIEQIGTYLPYVDIFVVDCFFAQVALESGRWLDQYRGRIRRLGEKHIGEFIDWLDQLVRDATHAPLTERIYAELDVGGSFRQFTDRMNWANATADDSLEP
jgi:hypothetical protein